MLYLFSQKYFCCYVEENDLFQFEKNVLCLQSVILSKRNLCASSQAELLAIFVLSAISVHIILLFSDCFNNTITNVETATACGNLLARKKLFMGTFNPVSICWQKRAESCGLIKSLCCSCKGCRKFQIQTYKKKPIVFC